MFVVAVVLVPYSAHATNNGATPADICGKLAVQSDWMDTDTSRELNRNVHSTAAGAHWHLLNMYALDVRNTSNV
jgi:hypothetical protein